MSTSKVLIFLPQILWLCSKYLSVPPRASSRKTRPALCECHILNHVIYSSRLLCPWNFPGNNTGLGCHFLLQGIFPCPGIKPESPVFYFTKWIIRSFLTVAFTVPFVKKFIFYFLPEFSVNHCKQPYVSQGTIFFNWKRSNQVSKYWAGQKVHNILLENPNGLFWPA